MTGVDEKNMQRIVAIRLTVREALMIQITMALASMEELVSEQTARDLVNKIQNAIEFNYKRLLSH